MYRPSIFIGYRRSDTADAAGRMFDKLVTAFGRNCVFKDVDLHIPLGADFRSHIAGVIGRSDIFLLLIGPRWTEPTVDGRSRLWETEDLVRIEIETALATNRVVVIPTLLSGAQMPSGNDIPESIRSILNLQAAAIRQDPDFRKDMSRMIADIKSRSLDAPSGEPLQRGSRRSAGPSRSNALSKPKFVLFGVGGAGGNVLATMISANIPGVVFVAANTDAEALSANPAVEKVILGKKVALGLGAGSRPEIGAEAAAECQDELGSGPVKLLAEALIG